MYNLNLSANRINAIPSAKNYDSCNFLLIKTLRLCPFCWQKTIFLSQHVCKWINQQHKSNMFCAYIRKHFSSSFFKISLFLTLFPPNNIIILQSVIIWLVTHSQTDIQTGFGTHNIRNKRDKKMHMKNVNHRAGKDLGDLLV